MGFPRSKIDLTGLHSLSFQEAYQCRYNQARTILYGCQGGLYKGKMTPAKLIREAHVQALVQAMEKEEPLPLAVLEEYRFYKNTASAVKRYLKRNGITID
jgi:hypothetical protein